MPYWKTRGSLLSNSGKPSLRKYVGEFKKRSSWKISSHVPAQLLTDIICWCSGITRARGLCVAQAWLVSSGIINSIPTETCFVFVLLFKKQNAKHLYIKKSASSSLNRDNLVFLGACTPTYLLGPVKSLFMQNRPHCALLPQPRTSSTIWYYSTIKEQHTMHATVLHCHVLIHFYKAINQNNWVEYKKICNKIKLIITGLLINNIHLGNIYVTIKCILF